MFERSVLVNLLANFLEEAKSSTHVDSKWWRTPELDGCVGHDAETARKAKVGDGADQAKLPGFSRLANVFFVFMPETNHARDPNKGPICSVWYTLGWVGCPPKVDSMTIAAKDILVGDGQAYLVECVARSAGQYFVLVEVLNLLTHEFACTSTWTRSGSFAMLAQDSVPPLQAAYLGVLKHAHAIEHSSLGESWR